MEENNKKPDVIDPLSVQNKRGDGTIIIQKKHLVIAGVVALILIIAGVITGIFWNRYAGQKMPDEPDSVKASLEIDPNAGNWQGDTPEDQGGEEVGIKIPGYPSITIDCDTEYVTMALLNPEGNPCYFKFEIVLKETEETLYESKYVPPGDVITDVILSRPLPEGEYPATIKISTIALDQETPLNGANVETILIAK